MNNPIENKDTQQEDNQSVNLIEEFMNLSDEENNIINSLRGEFSDLKFFNYGALVYLQKEDDNDGYPFPHISELLENYEKIFSVDCYLGYLVLRQTKYYIIQNDGLVIIADDAMGNLLTVFKIKNIVIMYNINKSENMTGKINYRILRILKALKII